MTGGHRNCRRNKIAILTVVFNNGVMGAEREVLEISDKKYGAMTVSGNYSKVPKDSMSRPPGSRSPTISCRRSRRRWRD